ncbi:hypothetical protein [Halovenus halobia]
MPEKTEIKTIPLGDNDIEIKHAESFRGSEPSPGIFHGTTTDREW